jgi:protein SMG8
VPSTKTPSNQNKEVEREEEEDINSFRSFLFEHVKIALQPDGFNDNIGRTNVYSIFKRLNAETWYKVFNQLSSFFLQNNNNNTTNPNRNQKTLEDKVFSQIKGYIDIDAQFSQNRCKKLIPTAINQFYQEGGLPPHYKREQHLKRLEKALNFYNSQARGPKMKYYFEKLKGDCEFIWQNGRQSCEAVSLTGQPCINQLHSLELTDQSDHSDNDSHSDSDHSNSALTKKKQNSPSSRGQSEIVADKRLINLTTSRNRSGSSSCRGASASAFTVDVDTMTSSSDSDNETNKPREDNKKVIQTSKSRSKSKQHLDLPVKPHNSTIITIAASNCGEYQAERTDPFHIKDANYNFYQKFKQNNNDLKRTQFHRLHHGQLNSKIIQVYHFPIAHNDDINFNLDLNSSEPIEIEKKEEFLFLKGMCHSDNILTGLLPLFSSWSLVSIGPSNDYNPQMGLTQPGFLPTHNFLVPWDIKIENNILIEHIDRPSNNNNNNNKGSFSRRNRRLKSQSNPPPVDSNVNNNKQQFRAYIGMEYECPCGHRFICSGPNRIIKVTSPNGNVKVTGNLVFFKDSFQNNLI